MWGWHRQHRLIFPDVLGQQGSSDTKRRRTLPLRTCLWPTNPPIAREAGDPGCSRNAPDGGNRRVAGSTNKAATSHATASPPHPRASLVSPSFRTSWTKGRPFAAPSRRHAGGPPPPPTPARKPSVYVMIRSQGAAAASPAAALLLWLLWFCQQR